MKRITFYKSVSPLVAGFCLLAAATIFLIACETDMDKGTYRVYDEKMLDEIMQEEGLTDFLTVAEKAGFFGTIHAYGTNTLFAPTNEGLNTYLQSIGKTDVNALTEQEAADMIKYHLVLDTLSTSDFVDGRLSSPNFAKKYLTTKSESNQGQLYFRVNRQANITKENLRGANGYLHIVDKVLTPPENSITEAIRALPDSEFSFLKSLFEESGWADSLSVEKEDNWYTFFVQTNQAFEEAGIQTREDLLAQLASSTPDVSADSLIYNFIGYRTTNRLMYVVDLLVSSGFTTLIPQQVITLRRNQEEVVLNQFEQFNEPGTLLSRGSVYTDLSCSNGVLQQIAGNIEIKNREAYRVYWDVAEQPEIMAMKNFRKAGASASFKPGDLSEIQWGGRGVRTVDYYCGSYPTFLDPKDQYVYRDRLIFGIHTNTTSWLEFTLPLLIKGKYKAWMCYRRLSETPVKLIFKQEGKDDQVLPYIFRMSDYSESPTAAGSHEALEQQGWKQYSAKEFNSAVISKLIGIIEVETTGRHVLRIEAQPGGRASAGNEINLDMIHFIPIEENQIWPRIDMRGVLFYEDMPACEAWPYDCVIEEPEEIE